MTDVTRPIARTVTAGDGRIQSPPAASQLPMVSLVVVAHRAARVIEGCLESLRRQDYPSSRREFVLVHSAADDGTLEAIERWRDGPARDERVVILANPKRILPCGWNVALAAVRGDVIIRIDAHAQAEPGFLRRNVEIMVERNESIVGGRAPTREPDGWEAYLCWLVSRSLFGAGQAAYRRRSSPGYVDTLAYAAYHRRVFERVGGFDERLARTEDNEIHHRMKQAGFRFYFDPTIESKQFARATVGGMLRQKFLNGYWVSLTMPIAPKCFSARHFVPGVFVLALVGALMLAPFGRALPLWLVGGSYAVAAILASLVEFGSARTWRALCLLPALPVTFFALHVANGVGLICGAASIPRKLRQWLGYAVPRPLNARTD